MVSSDLIGLGIAVVGGYYLFVLHPEILQGLGQRISSGIGGGGYAYGQQSPASPYAPSSRGYKSGGGSYGGGSPGWYTGGSNQGGHHHCQAYTSGCYCTDIKKCNSQGVPPKSAGECKPEFGSKQALGGGPYYDQSEVPSLIQLCPPGTH